jgi:hypothetical protein
MSYRLVCLKRKSPTEMENIDEVNTKIGSQAVLIQ